MTEEVRMLCFKCRRTFEESDTRVVFNVRSEGLDKVCPYCGSAYIEPELRVWDKSKAGK